MNLQAPQSSRSTRLPVDRLRDIFFKAHFNASRPTGKIFSRQSTD
ncbi:unnamed protein product [Rhodiola kirilowii]